MAKRLVQGPANPVYLVDGDSGEIVGTSKPQRVQIAEDAGLRDPIEGTAAASGDNVIIAAPGTGQRLVVTAFVIQNESATATTMILKDGDSPTGGRWRCLGQNQGDGLAMIFHPQHPWRLSLNSPLVLNLSGANQCGYSVQYYTEA
jgi:hypothetical protein